MSMNNLHSDHDLYQAVLFFQGSELPANAGEKQEEHRGSFLSCPPFQDSSFGSRAGKPQPRAFPECVAGAGGAVVF